MKPIRLIAGGYAAGKQLLGGAYPLFVIANILVGLLLNPSRKVLRKTGGAEGKMPRRSPVFPHFPHPQVWGRGLKRWGLFYK